MNYKIIIRVLGVLLIVESFFMFISTLVSLYYRQYDLEAFVISSVITMVIGLAAFFYTRNVRMSINKREGYIIVSLVWIVFSFFGLLPFYLSGGIPHFVDAFFETISGFTTTGSSILNDIEALPKGLLFWRSIIQWLGGMGIIVLSLAILPILGVGGMQLFVAEVPGPTPDKIHPRIKETAQRLWGIYILFTLIQAILLYIGGMTKFDAICHSFTTMATGGYSTHQASVGYFTSPFIQYVIIFFMFIAGTNFTLSYLMLHGRLKTVWRNEEFRFYTAVVLVFTVIITLGLQSARPETFEASFRAALFQVVSIITTTGYATEDYLLWLPLFSMLIFILMFFGGSAGSTGGGIKIVRIMLLLKNSVLELKRLIHPNAIIPVRFNDKSVGENIITNILAFVVFYMFIVGLSIIILSISGLKFDTAVGAVTTCIGNIGPGIGAVGPSATFAFMPDYIKWFLCFLMLLGRLELFTVLVLFAPAFWKQ